MPNQESKTYAASVLAELCARVAFGRNRLGVFAENVPAIDPRTFIAEIAKRTTRPARIALLGTTDKLGKAPAHIKITSDPLEANQWRNDSTARAGTPGIFLVLGPAQKLNSLRTAVPVLSATDVRQAIIARCLALHDTHERKAFLDAVGGLTGEISNAALAEYAAKIETAARQSKAALHEAESTAVDSLGLLASRSLFNATSAPAARKAIRRNIELTRSLKSMSAKMEGHLARLAESAHPLAGRAGIIMKYAGTRRLSDLAPLTHEDIDEVLRAGAPSEEGEPSPPRPPRRERTDGDALALDLILERDGHGLKVAAQRFNDAIEPGPEGTLGKDEFSVGGRIVIPQVKTGAAQATTLFGALLTEESWGGVVTARETLDFVSAIKLAASGDATVEPFRPTEDQSVRAILKRAVEQGIAERDALVSWDAYAAARVSLLPHVRALIDHPLLALGDAKLFEKATTLLDAYSAALTAVRAAAEKLRSASPQAARRMVAGLLALDIAFVNTRSEWVAVAAPTHPFHLWRWTSFHTLLNAHRDEMRELGSETLEPLVTDPPAVCPQIVLSEFALSGAPGASRPFVPVGTFAALPLFAEPTSRQTGRFRSGRALAKVAERLLRLMPHAALGLRVALVDPPSVAGALDDLLDLNSPFDDETLVPLHALVIRTRATGDATDEEDEAVSALARDLADHGGTLDVPTLPESNRGGLDAAADLLAANPAHIAVVFDPGAGERLNVPLMQRPILSPLVVPRAYRYDRFEDRLDLVVAGDAEPFATYHDFFCETVGIPQDSFVGRRSGAFQSAKQIEAIARGAVWTVVVDQAIEPTLRVEGASRIDWRTHGGRDLVTFTAHPETIENLIGDALRVAGLVPDEESRKRMLSQLLLLSGEAVLALARAKPGTSLAEPRIAKGTVGVLAAVRWYMEAHPEALVISLDDPTSRLWVLGVSDDDRHGDLLAVRPTNDGVVVEPLEVKAHDLESATVYDRGNVIDGKAVVQVDQTIHAVRSILTTAPASPILRARQDILRDQLYRAVASRPYKSDVRGRLVTMLEDLFERGAHGVTGIIFRVRIGSGETRRDAAPLWKTSPRGNQVGLIDLTESSPAGKFKAPSPPEPIGHRKPTQPDSRHAKKRGEERKFPPDLALTVADAHAKPPYSRAGQESPPDATRSVKVLIGNSAAGADVFWEPHRQDAPLNNFGFLITGDPGSGKTQIIKALIAELAVQRYPICVFDFKNDYAEGDFPKAHDLRVHDVNRRGLPFNPLSLLADASGEVQPIRQVHELSDILKRIYQLGARQSAKLREAMISAYERHGVQVSNWQRADAVKSVPDFREVKSHLESAEKNEGVLDRLSPLFDLDLFPDARAATTTFEEMLQQRVVLDLHNLPNDSVKAAMAEFIIVRLHGQVLKGEQPRELRRVLVFDEAWRVKESQRLQELAREGRAFGVGIVIGTQFPGDIPENLAGNLATRLLLSNQDPDHRKAVLRMLVGAASGPEATTLSRTLALLQKHEGYLQNQQHAPYVRVMTVPYYLR